MRTVLQRVDEARVVVGGKRVARIERGLLLLTAVEAGDTEASAMAHAEKLAALRVFPDGEKAFDKPVGDVGEVLAVSNFTVAAATAKGRRPALAPAAGPKEANALFGRFVDRLRELGLPVATGIFGADMKVHSINDGPVTFIVGGAGDAR
ncbi:MAG: D-aminoacyl-tRNA deacylase [Planctomycetota bacterium]